MNQFREGGHYRTHYTIGDSYEMFVYERAEILKKTGDKYPCIYAALRNSLPAYHKITADKNGNETVTIKGHIFRADF